MNSVSPSVDMLDQTLTEVGRPDALDHIAQALEMQWGDDTREAIDPSGTWPMGRTIWFAVSASLALWGVIFAVVWLV